MVQSISLSLIKQYSEKHIKGIFVMSAQNKKMLINKCQTSNKQLYVRSNNQILLADSKIKYILQKKLIYVVQNLGNPFI